MVHHNSIIRTADVWDNDKTPCRLIPMRSFVLKHNGIYYLTYSANYTRYDDYMVGYATSNAPIGPLKKSTNNPILHKFDDIIGTGHHSFMPTDDANKYICIYHCHGGNISGFKSRKICFAEAEFVNDELIIKQ